MPDAPYQIYRTEYRRRRRWPYFVIAAVCLFAAVVGWQVYGVPRVSATTPGPGAYVKDASPTLTLDVKGLSGLKDVAVTFDGRDVTAQTRREGDTLTLPATALDDGQHSVSFSARSSNLFRRDLRDHDHRALSAALAEAGWRVRHLCPAGPAPSPPEVAGVVIDPAAAPRRRGQSIPNASHATVRGVRGAAAARLTGGRLSHCNTPPIPQPSECPPPDPAHVHPPAPAQKP